ncbi:MAG: bifunctional precorrin-2 dehydrogenase/sirohydrochlorin ferrochelatase [Nitrospirae bacterium]|nr:bifunctional precorrin-2 dehydrogenase/sirohydrochlorin ferrochelatase [Nitrospirota bacterium]
MKYYPLFLDLKGKKCVVIGGGAVGERKASLLIKAGASVEVISPSLTPRLKLYKALKKIKHKARNFKRGDLKGALLAFACSSSRETNRSVADDAKLLFPSPLLNVADKPSECDFIVPSCVTCASLTIAISTAGSSPAVAKAVRKEIEGIYDKDFGKYLRHAEALRKKAMKKIPGGKERERFLKSLASEKIFSALRTEGFRSVSKNASGLLKKH